MSNQSNGYDDPKNLRRNREVRERSNSSSTNSKDFLRLQAERKERVDGIEKSMAQQKAAQDQIDKQLVNRENKDTNPPEFPFIRTKEYEDIRANALQAAEGRRKVEQQSLSQERQIELSKRVLSEMRLAGDSRRKTLVDTKFNSDRSISASNNTDVPTYTGEEAIKQIEALEALEKTGRSFYAYSSEGEIHITSEEKAKEKLGNEAMDSLKKLGESYYTNDTPPKRIRRIDLEDAKGGIQVAKLELRLDITAPQVEKPQDTKADTIETKEAQEKTVEMVRGKAFAKLGYEIRNPQVWSESADSWKNPRMDLRVMKENEPLAFRNQEDGAVTVTWDNNYSRPNETSVPLNYAERIINEKGIDGVKWDLPTVYALKSEPKNLGDKLEVIVTDHEETANRLENVWGYRSLGELKIGDQDVKTNDNQKWTSVKDFVGPAYADKLPVWMQKDDIRIEDFIEYQKNKSLTPQEFMLRAQGQPLEHETVQSDARDTLKQEQEHDDQGADIREKLSRVEKTFAKDDKGKAFNELKENLDKLYARISERSVPKEVSEQAEEMKERADIYQIQIEAFFKLKEANPSLNGDYDLHRNRMAKDMKESVKFMKESLKSETQEGDSPARSVAAILRTGRVNFMQRVDFYGNNQARQASLNDYDQLVDDVKSIEDRLLKKGISQKDIYKQVEGRVNSYEGRINAAIEIGDIGREHSLPLEGTTRSIKEDLIEFEAREDFVSSVENVLGKKGSTDKTRQFSEKVYDDLKANGVDQTRMRLSMGIIEQNKENITTWLEDRETTEIHINEASQWLMNQVDQLSQRRNDPYADASAQFRREMGIRGTGETMA